MDNQTAQDTAETLLSKHQVFSKLTPEELSRLTEPGPDRGGLRSYKAGELIYSPESFRKAAGLVVKGSLTVTRAGDPGVLLNILKKSDVFGIAALFSTKGDSYVTEVRARTDSEVFFIPGSAISELVRENPDFAESYISYLSDKIRFLNGRITDFTAPSVEKRLARFLAERARTEGNVLKPNKTALAKALNVGRASLYRAFTELENRGLITLDSGCIRVNDRANLCEFAS